MGVSNRGVSNGGINNRGVGNGGVSNGGVNNRVVINRTCDFASGSFFGHRFFLLPWTGHSRSDKKMLQTLLISCKLEMKLVFKLHPLHSIRNY